jgi:glycosyltransferase involved in cell wall biosynthesis
MAFDIGLQKTKILMISDHQLSTSGVGLQARWLINGLVNSGKYSFKCFGAAVKHENYDPVKVNDDFIIQPIDGFGNPMLIRQALVVEKPDALMLFTDPRFFMHIWEIEDEIHQMCPIIYNHLWDNIPIPDFNKVLYESTDLINCINYPTYEFVNNWYPEKTNYIPHAVPKDLYFPMPNDVRKDNKFKLLGPEKADHWIAIYVGRNAKRKMVNDILMSWSEFLIQLEKEYGHRKASLILHTDPLDKEGPNLFKTVEMLGIKDNILFSTERADFQMMNVLYNISDVQLNRSSAEGFGLPILEGKLTGLPAVVIKTGGLTRQVEDYITGEEYGVGLDPEIQSCVGNQSIPYIYEDLVSNTTYTNSIMKMYKVPQGVKEELKSRCREHCIRDYNIDFMVNKWDETIQNTLKTWKNNYSPWCVHEI